MRTSIVLAAAASLSTASAAIQGFNYGSTKSDSTFMYYADFKDKFTTAQGLVGASGFNSARLYTMIVS
jgi:glucan endo-1,3-beta-D-glucosidase